MRRPSRAWSIGGGVLVAVAVAVLVVVLTTRGDDHDEAPREQHPDAVAVAKDYLDAFASADVEALCDTYDAASQRRAFRTYDVDDCAAYAAAHMADKSSGYSVTAYISAQFETDTSRGDDRRVEVPFSGTVTYNGKDQAAIDYYEEHPTVSGSVVLVREGGGWAVDAKATEATY